MRNEKNTKIKMHSEIPKKPGLAKQLPLLLEGYLGTSSFHGLSQISLAKHLIRKLLWFILFVASASYCSYSLYDSFFNYFQYPVVTNTERITSNGDPIPFPAFTICQSSNKTVDQMLVKSISTFPQASPRLPYSSLDFTVTHSYADIQSGTCFTFNKHGNVRAYSRTFSFKIELFLGVESGTLFPNGAHVIIHNSSGYKPYTDGFDVPTGKFVLLSN